MAVGAALANFSRETAKIMHITDGFTPPLFMLFFVGSGAELQLSILSSIGVAGVIYVVLRVVGKMGGTAFAATICKADSKIKKYLGLALVPQAGVAIGLSLVATTAVPQFGATIRAVPHEPAQRRFHAPRSLAEADRLLRRPEHGEGGGDY